MNPLDRTYRLDTLRGTRGRSARAYRQCRASFRATNRAAIAGRHSWRAFGDDSRGSFTPGDLAGTGAMESDGRYHDSLRRMRHFHIAHLTLHRRCRTTGRPWYEAGPMGDHYRSMDTAYDATLRRGRVDCYRMAF